MTDIKNLWTNLPVEVKRELKKAKKGSKEYKNRIDRRKLERVLSQGEWYYTYTTFNKNGVSHENVGSTCKYIGLSNQCYRKYTTKVMGE